MARRGRSGEVARRDASNSASNAGRRGASRGREHPPSGEGSPRERLGLARRLPRGGAPARAARRQVRAPGQARTGNPPQRPRELASARTASGHEHQGDDAKPRLPPKSQDLGTCAVRGEVRSPNHQRGMAGVSRNLSRAPTASLRDRPRRHLTEPVRRGTPPLAPLS